MRILFSGSQPLPFSSYTNIAEKPRQHIYITRYPYLIRTGQVLSLHIPLNNYGGPVRPNTYNQTRTA